MILAASNPRAIDKMVVWGANASVTQEDVDMYDKARDVDKWNPKMRDPLEGKLTLIISFIIWGQRAIL